MNFHNLKKWITHNFLILWLISGFIYIISIPFIVFYNIVPAQSHLLIILGDIDGVIVFIISFILAILIASYLLRHFQIIYYPKGRRVFK